MRSLAGLELSYPGWHFWVSAHCHVLTYTSMDRNRREDISTLGPISSTRLRIQDQVRALQTVSIASKWPGNPDPPAHQYRKLLSHLNNQRQQHPSQSRHRGRSATPALNLVLPWPDIPHSLTSPPADRCFPLSVHTKAPATPTHLTVATVRAGSIPGKKADMERLPRRNTGSFRTPFTNVFSTPHTCQPFSAPSAPLSSPTTPPASRPWWPPHPTSSCVPYAAGALAPC